MTKLILIRHGESIFNIEKRYTGQTDTPLTESGIKQARITAEYILKNYGIEAVYSSDLSRAIETARPIAEPLGLEIRTDPRLREIYAGEWQGLYFTEVMEKYKDEYALYRADKLRGRTSGGESMPEVQQRVLRAVLDIAKENDGKQVLISTHNGPLVSLEAYFLGISLNDVNKSLPNSSITEVDFENGSFKLVRLGYDGHLGKLSTNFKSASEN